MLTLAFEGIMRRTPTELEAICQVYRLGRWAFRRATYVQEAVLTTWKRSTGRLLALLAFPDRGSGTITVAPTCVAVQL